MSRTKSTLTDRTTVSFEWFQHGKWLVHTPLIPTRALGHAIRELKAQSDTIRNVHVVLAK